MTSIFHPLAWKPESSAAIWAASVDPAPPRSEYSPELSVRTPIFTVLSCADAIPAVASANAVPSNNVEILLFILVSPPLAFQTARSNAEISMKLVHIGLQVRVGKTVDDLAVLDDVVAIRDGGCEAEVLLDEQDGKTLRFEPRDRVSDLLDDDRSQSLGRLVEHQKAGAGAQNARDRQHLLLA